jgi:hypothetical protein
VIANEQGKTVRDSWDGVNLKFTFCRIVDMMLLNQWDEVIQIASSLSYVDEDDAIIWKFNSSGIYSVQSLYAVINDRGVRQIFTPAVWQIVVPSRLHIFLCCWQTIKP